MIDTIKTLEIIHHIPIARHSAPNVLDSAASSPAAGSYSSTSRVLTPEPAPSPLPRTEKIVLC